MAMDPKDIVEIIKALAWPVTALIAAAVFYVPIAGLIKTVSNRATKLSAFKIDIELSKLTKAQSDLETTVEGLRQVVIAESQAGIIAGGVSQSGTADYVLIALGADSDQEWLTSRLFLVSAILERSRVVRCIVFTGQNSLFLGAATPRDVRAELGTKFPEYEKAILRAYSAAAWADIREFRSGNLGINVVSSITHEFLRIGGEIVQPEYANPQGSAWVRVEHQHALPTWELAEWVTAGGLASMLKGRFAGGSVRASLGNAKDDVTRAIIREQGAFVGLVNDAGQFQALCDRAVITDKIARSAAEQ